METLLVAHFVLAGAARLMALKGHEHVFVTRSGSTLTLAGPRISGFGNQRVSVHNRILYFEEDGQRYSLVMFSRDIEVKVAKSTGERSVSFFSKKRSLDLFHLGTVSDEEKKPEGPEERAGPARKRPRARKTHRPSSEPAFLDPNEKFRVAKPGPGARPADTALDTGAAPERRAAAPRGRAAPPRAVDHGAREPEEPPAEETPRTPPPPRMPVSQRETAFHVESDSSIDDGISYAIRNVRIMELDSEYFALVSENNICVTYFENKFIFARCAKSEGQKFRLHNIEDVKRTYAQKGVDGRLRTDRLLGGDTAQVPPLRPVLEYVPQIPDALAPPARGIQSPRGIAGAPFAPEERRAVVNTEKAPLGLALDSDSMEYDLGRGAFTRESMLSKLKKTLDAANISEF